MTSGSCELDLDKTVCKFIKDYLVDIHDNGKMITLTFSNDNIPNEIRNIKGYLSTEKNLVKFTKLSERVVNNDVLSTVIQVKELMKKCNGSELMTPSEYYANLMKCILEVGNLYSSFVEMVLAHMFMVSPTEFWRYNQDKSVVVKLSEKTIASKISSLLGFLYQPNSHSVKEIDFQDLDKFEPVNLDKLCIHEKIFLNKL